MKVFFGLLLVVASATAGLIDINEDNIRTRSSPMLASPPDGRITHGKDAAVGQFPYQVGLNFSSADGPLWCGGILIAKDWVLTAAHCIYQNDNVTVLLGTTLLTRPNITQIVTKDNFIIHPNFDYEILRYDVALIKIAPVKLNKYINKVRLPAISSTPSNYVGQTAIASGWGLVSDNATRLSPALQYATLTVVSNEECAPFYKTHVIGEDIICTSNVAGISACNGDSGGPLTQASTGELIGLFSYVPDDGCEFGGPAAFTRITYYAQWIKEKSGVSF